MIYIFKEGEMMKERSPAICFIFFVAVICISSQFFVVPPSSAEEMATAAGEKKTEETAMFSRGHYLAIITGCNDCHTRGWTTKNGNVPEAEWLTGDIIGWWGPWGTTYPVNLRLFFQGITEEAWMLLARTMQARPPMPWYAVRQMKEEDLRAIYHFIGSLGPQGENALPFLPPGREPKPPYFHFVTPSSE
jgi:mono/diheme cytochrome c family protein